MDRRENEMGYGGAPEVGEKRWLRSMGEVMVGAAQSKIQSDPARFRRGPSCARALSMFGGRKRELIVPEVDVVRCLRDEHTWRRSYMIYCTLWTGLNDERRYSRCKQGSIRVSCRLSGNGPVSLRNSVGEPDEQRKERVCFAESVELDLVGHLPLVLVAGG